MTGPRGTPPPLDLRAVGLSREDRKRLQSADLSNLRDQDVAFVVGRLEQLDTEVAALLAYARALRRLLRDLIAWQVAGLETEPALEALEQILARAVAVLGAAQDTEKLEE